MNTFSGLWEKLRKSKKYREEFVAAQVKRGIPFQIRSLMKTKGLSQEGLAENSGLTQGVISRAANPNYGNLTLNTIIRIAAGFDVAFVGEFVPFSELGRWFTTLDEDSVRVPSFGEEDQRQAARELASMADHREDLGAGYSNVEDSLSRRLLGRKVVPIEERRKLMAPKKPQTRSVEPTEIYGDIPERRSLYG